MAEATLDLGGQPKREAYRQLEQHVRAVLDGVDDEICAMATVSSLVHQGFGHLWTGFYRVVGPRLLRVGPYQGSLGCLEIPFGKGVCGTAAEAEKPVVVADVSAFAGHISCDSRSVSEIVVPVFGKSGALIAVFDVDSVERGRFDDVDAECLSRMLEVFRQVK
jgi:GAF domain-containing protein